MPVLDLLLQTLSSLRDVPRPFAGFASPSGLLRVQGFAFASVAQVEVILVKRELIVFQNPTLPTRAVEGLRPTSRSCNLVWSLLQRDVGERPTYVQNFWVGAVAPDGSAVDPAYIGGSAVVVRVGQTASVVSEVHTGCLATSLPLRSKVPSTPAVRRSLSIS